MSAWRDGDAKTEVLQQMQSNPISPETRTFGPARLIS